MKKETLASRGIRRGDRQLMAEMNRNLVLNVLRTGTASRADIARVTKLSPATVSAIVAELAANDLVTEVGHGTSTGGRPPLVLKLNDEARYVVGLKLMPHAISAVMTDLNAEIVHAEVFDLPAELIARRPARLDQPLDGGGPPRAAVPVEPVLDAVCAAVRATIEHAAIPGPGTVVGVGAGLGGLVDAESGVCRYSSAFGWSDVAIAGPLAARLGLPVIVDNDVNTLTIAEQWFGRGHGVDHFVVVTVGSGIGAGIVVNGTLYRGADGGAGELGHLPIAGADVHCGCGAVGCLEAAASDEAILRRARRAGAASVASIADVCRAAEAGDDACGAALREAGAMLGLGIAAVVNMLNPRLIILGGEGVEAGPLRFDAMIGTLREHAFGDLAQDVHVVTAPIDDVAWARGAACVVLGEMFAPPAHRSRTFSAMVSAASPGGTRRE